VAGLYDLIAPPVNSVFEQNCKLSRFSGLLSLSRSLTAPQNHKFMAVFRQIKLFFKTRKIICIILKYIDIILATTILQPYFSSLTVQSG